MNNFYFYLCKLNFRKINKILRKEQNRPQFCAKKSHLIWISSTNRIRLFRTGMFSGLSFCRSCSRTQNPPSLVRVFPFFFGNWILQHQRNEIWTWWDTSILFPFKITWQVIDEISKVFIGFSERIISQLPRDHAHGCPDRRSGIVRIYARPIVADRSRKQSFTHFG